MLFRSRNPEAFADVRKGLARGALGLSAAAQAVAVRKVEELDGYRAALVSKISGQQAAEMLADGQHVTNVQVNVALALSENMRALATLSARTASNQAGQSKPADQPASQPSPATKRAEPA